MSYCNEPHREKNGTNDREGNNQELRKSGADFLDSLTRCECGI